MALSASRGHESRGLWDGGPIGGQAEPASHVLDGTGATAVRLPDAAFLTDGQFVRDGGDLKIELPDGRTAIVEGYFHGLQSPDLVGPDSGATLTPALVQSFLGSLAPGQYAQAAPAAAAQPIGHVEALDGNASAVHADGTRVSLEKGDPVFQGDVIETGGDASAVRLLFSDKTVFALGPDARLALDEMVFDNASQEGSIQFSILKGVFIFASGQIAKTDNTDMTVTTPVATIGIRGTEVAGRVADGDSHFTIIDGAIEVTTRAGSVALDDRGETTDVTGMDSPPSPPYLLTPTQYADAYKAVVGIAGEYFNGGGSGGDDVPDHGDSGPADHRGDLDGNHDGGGTTDHATADGDGDVVMARTIGGDTTTLFGGTTASGEAWSVTDGSTGGAAYDGSGDGPLPATGDVAAEGGDPADVTEPGGIPYVGTTDAGTSYPGTTDPGTVDGATTDSGVSGTGNDDLLALAADVILSDGSLSVGSFDLSAFGGDASPFREIQGDEPLGWTNVYWGTGGPDDFGPDFGWQETAAVNSSPDDFEDFGGGLVNGYQEIAALSHDQATLAEGITLVVSHKSIKASEPDPSDSVVLDDLGPGSTMTITGDDLGLTGIAADAQITLHRDAVDSVDVTLDSAWNSIQNIWVESAESGDVSVTNFVHTDVQLGDGGDSTITITDAKRGFITTGDGDDYVSIQAASDGFAGSTTFDVKTGAGDDTVVFSGAADGKAALTFDGGEGVDTLCLTGPLTNFDLTASNYDLANLERLDISGASDVSVTLSADEIAAITEDFNDVTASANTLVVAGDAGDKLDLGADWTAVDTTDIDGAGYTIYEHADGARVVADSDITVV